ncbi:MAG TPA: winged helix-turn-helix domain-containing protein [Gemmatimonadaceae bacterium]
MRPRVAALTRALERYGITARTIGWRASSSGLWRMSAQPPNAVLLDAPPPVTAEYIEVLHRLRDRWEHAPQIVIAPGASPSVLTSLLAVGVDDFVATDESTAEVIIRLRRQLRRVLPLATPMTMGPDGMQLDAARRTVSANGRSVTLTTTEFNVFRCLTDSGGTTLTREQILRCVWGDTADGPATPGIVGVYVLYLRRKLVKVGLAHALRTVKGEGYRFQAPGEYWAPARSLTPAGGSSGTRAGAGDLHPSAVARDSAAANDDLDVAAQPKKNPDQPVRRKAL